MAYSLDSFSLEFWGNPNGERISRWVNAKTIAQALWNMRHEAWTDMIRNLFPGHSAQDVGLDEDVMTLIRETNTCTNLDSPVEVWIDKEGDYKIKVYE